MAVYEPRLAWLRQQLESLEGQTYPRLRLYIRDDCSPTVPLSDIEGLVRECIRSFPWELRRNEENLGSNATFQRLTEEVEGDCFAYCDQDDVWLPEKLAVLQEAMAREQALLVCSDVLVIDGEGKQIADSAAGLHRFSRPHSGAGSAKELLVKNYVTGCTALVARETARAAVPFCPCMVYDHYLALRAAMAGRLIALPQPLIRRRIHGNNQTGSLRGVTDKQSYYERQILGDVARFTWLCENTEERAEIYPELEQALTWSRARAAAFGGDGGARRTVWRYRRFSVMTSVFELVFFRLPQPLFLAAVRLRQKGLL